MGDGGLLGVRDVEPVRRYERDAVRARKREPERVVERGREQLVGPTAPQVRASECPRRSARGIARWRHRSCRSRTGSLADRRSASSGTSSAPSRQVRASRPVARDLPRFVRVAAGPDQGGVDVSAPIGGETEDAVIAGVVVALESVEHGQRRHRTVACDGKYLGDEVLSVVSRVGEVDDALPPTAIPSGYLPGGSGRSFVRHRGEAGHRDGPVQHASTLTPRCRRRSPSTRRGRRQAQAGQDRRGERMRTRTWPTPRDACRSIPSLPPARER